MLSQRVIWQRQKLRPVLSDTTATSHPELVLLKLLKLNRILKFSSSITLATSQVPDSHMNVVVTVLTCTDGEHFHHCRKFFWTALT